MLEYYRHADGALGRVETCDPGCWVNAVAPTAEEIEVLHARFGVPRDVLAYALDPDERPRYERDGDCVLLLLQTSVPLGSGSDVPFDTVPLAIVHTPTNVVTVSTQPSPALEDLKAGRVRGVSTAKRFRFTLQIFLRVAQRYLIDLRAVNRMVEAVEDRLESSTRNRELLQLLRLQKSLVYFKTALKANELMMERVRRERVFEAYEEDAGLLDDVLIENQQAIEMTGIATDILTSMMDAFASVISNNLNVVAKVLTLGTIMVAVPTWITGLFGMNVPIPLQTRPWAFELVLGLSLGAVLTLLAVFRRLRLL